MEQRYPVELLPLGCFVDGKLHAVIPLLRRKLGPVMIHGAPLRKTPVPPATPFCAPAAEAGLALTAFDAWVRGRRLGYVQATVPGPGMAVVSAGGASEQLDNLELQLLRPLPELWQLLPKKTRYTVRRAVKEGVKLHWASSLGFMATQLRLLQDTYGRQGIEPNYPPELYQALLERRRETGLHILYASFQDRVIAAAWLLIDAQCCHYWDAATSTEGRDLNASQVLVWGLIRWAHRRGFSTIDFVGTAVGGRAGGRPGIGHFKRSMGAAPVEYHVVYWYSSFYRLALSLYRFTARLRRYSRCRPSREKPG